MPADWSTRSSAAPLDEPCLRDLAWGLDLQQCLSVIVNLPKAARRDAWRGSPRVLCRRKLPASWRSDGGLGTLCRASPPWWEEDRQAATSHHPSCGVAASLERFWSWSSPIWRTSLLPLCEVEPVRLPVSENSATLARTGRRCESDSSDVCDI